MFNDDDDDVIGMSMSRDLTSRRRSARTR